MKYFETILNRYSVRAYQAKPVKEEKLMKIMGAGLHSASANNRQPYKVYVVQDENIRKKIVRANSPINFWMKDVPVIMVIAVKTTGDQEEMKERYLDAGIMIANMMLAATALGLGSCACGAYDDNKVRDILKFQSFDLLQE